MCHCHSYCLIQCQDSSFLSPGHNLDMLFPTHDHNTQDLSRHDTIIAGVRAAISRGADKPGQQPPCRTEQLLGENQTAGRRAGEFSLLLEFH